MLGRRAKVGVLIVALAALIVEAYLLNGYYDRYYGRSAADTAADGFTRSEETTHRLASSSVDATVPEVTAAPTAGEIGLGVPGLKTSFVHRATDDNSRGDYTYIADPSIDGDPNAAVLVVPAPNPRAGGGSAYDHNIGVWYDFSDRQRWAIFNQDRAAVPAGAAFEVVLPEESESFVHRANSANTEGNTTYLDDPLTNDQPDAVVQVTQNWNPGGGLGVYNDHPVGVRYEENRGGWTVYNKDGALMPEGAAFNVAVSRGGGSAR